MKRLISSVGNELKKSNILIIWCFICFGLFVWEMGYFWQNDILGREFHLTSFQAWTGILGMVSLNVICAIIPIWLYHEYKENFYPVLAMVLTIILIYGSHKLDNEKTQYNILKKTQPQDLEHYDSNSEN